MRVCQVAAVCGFLILTPPRWFRLFHFAHHRFTHDAGNDPELDPAKARTLAGYLAYMSGLPVWRSLAGGLIVNAMGRNDDPFVGAKEHAKISQEARWTLALYALTVGASYALASDLLIWTWWLPALIGQPFLRGYLLAAENKIQEAEQQFQEAVDTDGGLGHAWLGLGLVKIKQGRDEEGRQDMQTAAVSSEERRAGKE